MRATSQGQAILDDVLTAIEDNLRDLPDGLYGPLTQLARAQADMFPDPETRGYFTNLVELIERAPPEGVGPIGSSRWADERMLISPLGARQIIANTRSFGSYIGSRPR